MNQVLCRLFLLASPVFLCACSNTQVVEKPAPVEVVHEKYVPLDQTLLADCPNRPQDVTNGKTNGELRASLLAWQIVYGPCIEGKLASIRSLQPQK